MILPVIVNNTDKIIIIDSGDILAQKDLSEIFFYDLEDNYFGWTLEFLLEIKGVGIILLKMYFFQMLEYA